MGRYLDDGTWTGAAYVPGETGRGGAISYTASYDRFGNVTGVEEGIGDTSATRMKVYDPAGLLRVDSYSMPTGREFATNYNYDGLPGVVSGMDVEASAGSGVPLAATAYYWESGHDGPRRSGLYAGSDSPEDLANNPLTTRFTYQAGTDVENGWVTGVGDQWADYYYPGRFPQAARTVDTYDPATGLLSSRQTVVGAAAYEGGDGINVAGVTGDVTTLYEADYVYYSAGSGHGGQVLRMQVKQLNPDNSTTGYYVAYAYDAYNQLASATTYPGVYAANATVSAMTTETFTLDALGNRLSQNADSMNRYATDGGGHTLTYAPRLPGA